MEIVRFNIENQELEFILLIMMENDICDPCRFIVLPFESLN